MKLDTCAFRGRIRQNTRMFPFSLTNSLNRLRRSRRSLFRSCCSILGCQIRPETISITDDEIDLSGRNRRTRKAQRTSWSGNRWKGEKSCFSSFFFWMALVAASFVWALAASELLCTSVVGKVETKSPPPSSSPASLPYHANTSLNSV